MPHATPLITTLALGFVLAFACGLLAQRMRLSPLVGYLVAGMLVGPFTPGPSVDAAMAGELAEIGVILLMFGVGLHFSLEDLLEVKAVAVPGALFQMGTATVLGWGLARGLGWDNVQGLVFGLALSAASTVVLLRSLEDHRLLDTRGKHDEALRTLPKSFASFGPYGLIFNAIWRGDLDRALALANTMEQVNSRGDTYVYEFKPSYVAAVTALRDPSRWPEARRVFDESERRTGLMNFLRVFDPDYPPAKLVEGLDTTRRRAYSTWDLLLWTHDLSRIRRDPAFEAYLRSSGILDYWKRHGFPPQCRPRGDGASCD